MPFCMWDIYYTLNEPELQCTNPILAIPIILARIIWRYKWTIWISILLTIYIFYKKRKNVLFSKKEINLLVNINLMVFIINSYLSKELLGCIYIAGVLFVAPVIYTFGRWQKIDKI